MKSKATVKKVGPHVVPEVLAGFETWFDAQPAGLFGIEAVHFEEIHEGWDPELTPQLRKAGFVFFTLGEGSMVCTLRVGEATPVVLLDSEGGYRQLAASIEEFFVKWSKGETDIHEIDDTEDYDGIGPKGKAALKEWIKAQRLKVAKPPAFDLDVYLAGGSAASPAPAAPAKAPKAAPIEGLPAKFAAMVDVVGRRVDDPVVVDILTKQLKKKIPSTSAENESDYISAKGVPFGFGVSHEVHHDAYPPVAKTKRAYIPYVTEINLEAKWPEALPFGLTRDADAAKLTKLLGEPRVKREFLGSEEFESTWRKDLDPARGIVLQVAPHPKGLSVYILIAEAYDLVSSVLVPDDKYEIGLLVAWAISRGLLDVSRFPGHEALIADIEKRKAQGSALVEAAMSRGLWDDHFLDAPGEAALPAAGLRDRLWHYFAGEPTHDGDLRKLFGSVEGPHGHPKAKLPTDSWDAVDKATPRLDEVFATWIEKKKQKG